MSIKKPLCNYIGTVKELQSGDTIEATSTGLEVPIGTILPWHKTFFKKTYGTTTSASTSKLINTGDTFETDGITAGMTVVNTTDDTYPYIVSVDNETALTIADDIFASGEDYDIYATPHLEDNWIECDGQSITDAESPYYGATAPSLNSTQKFIRGGHISGEVQGDTFQEHKHTKGDLAISASGTHTHAATQLGYGLTPNDGGDFAGGGSWAYKYGGAYNTGSSTHTHANGDVSGTPGVAVTDGTHGTPRTDSETRPTNIVMVWIMRIK
jgi:hypothetical protein